MANFDEELARIEEELSPPSGSGTSRRGFLAGAAAAAAGTVVATGASTASAAPDVNLAAQPPAGFAPFTAPGRVIKVNKADCMQENQLYPKADAAKVMLEKAMTELTGKPDLVSAVGQFVHKDEIVCVKVNGIARESMGTNKELVLPFLEALIASGVKPENITVLEQYIGFLHGTRVNAQNVPKGVKTVVHQNAKDNPAMATMPDRLIPGTGVRTKFVKPFTDATAVFNFALVKDHSICGYTGALKNMTHGCSINPHDFHVHNASPQIALMFAQDVVKTRVRLNIADVFKVMAQGGPLYKSPQHVKVHGAVMVSTDPVAIDAVGWDIVEKLRADLGLRSLKDDKREPTYIKAAADLGLGMFDRAQIKLKEVTV
jgi:uncharacterized protein (DUF362 family)